MARIGAEEVLRVPVWRAICGFAGGRAEDEAEDDVDIWWGAGVVVVEEEDLLCVVAVVEEERLLLGVAGAEGWWDTGTLAEPLPTSTKLNLRLRKGGAEGIVSGDSGAVGRF